MRDCSEFDESPRSGERGYKRQRVDSPYQHFLKTGKSDAPDKSSRHTPCAVRNWRNPSRYGTRSVPITIKDGQECPSYMTSEPGSWSDDFAPGVGQLFEDFERRRVAVRVFFAGEFTGEPVEVGAQLCG